MCLDTITEHPSLTEGEGIKFFFRSGDGVYSTRNAEEGKPLPLKQWLTADETALLFARDGEGEYTSGFHYCVTLTPEQRQDIRNRFEGNRGLFPEWLTGLCFFRVKLRGIHTLGTQSRYEVGVAREVYLDEEILD